MQNTLKPSLFPTLATRLLPRTGLARDAALVLGGAALIALSAHVRIPLAPVPVTLQTLAVLLVGASLGAGRGFLAVAVYLLAGLVGLPVLAGASLTGATGGYLLGFLLAAPLVGALVQRAGLDRTPWGTALAMLAGNIVIYAFGLLWLGVVTHLHGAALLHAGLIPFLPGDLLKLLLAAGLLPGAWAVLRR